MRVKEWHTISVGGRQVCHDLEPVVYRKGKTNVRIEGMWYCPECDDVVDMKRLTSQGFDRRPRGLNGRYTSMFKKGLRSEGMPRLPEAVEKKISTVEESLPEGGESNVSPIVELEPAKIASDSPKEKQPRIMGHHPCPCGSGKKYRDCCRPKLS